MAHLRDYMNNPLWKHTYNQGMFHENEVNEKYVQLKHKDASFEPLTTFGGDRYAIKFNRYCSGPCPYDTYVAGVPNNVKHSIERCTDSTANPFACIHDVIGKSSGHSTYRRV